MSEHKLSIAARFFKHDKPRSEKLSGAEKRKLLRFQSAFIRGEWRQLQVSPPIVSRRVKRGNPARNPTALV